MDVNECTLMAIITMKFIFVQLTVVTPQSDMQSTCTVKTGVGNSVVTHV